MPRYVEKNVGGDVMATRQEMEATYNYMDEIFRLSLGETGDCSGAMYNGDFGKTLGQAQKDKHDYALDALDLHAGSRMLDIGCGWGAMLRAVKERGGDGIGITLSNKQAESCRRNNLEAYVKDWKDVSAETFGKFDGIVSLGAFEHFCSVEEYVTGQQEEIYRNFFELCYELLPEGGRLYLQTMMWGKDSPEYEDISLKASKGSNEYMLAVLGKFYSEGSWLPSGEEQIIRTAKPYLKVISLNNGRRDYIETLRQWDVIWKPSPAKVIAALRSRNGTTYPLKLTSSQVRGSQKCLTG
ncbi:MAG: SAM-dependent methyltransferase [Pseudonocardiaceae bacterium]